MLDRVAGGRAAAMGAGLVITITLVAVVAAILLVVLARRAGRAAPVH